MHIIEMNEEKGQKPVRNNMSPGRIAWMIAHDTSDSIGNQFVGIRHERFVPQVAKQTFVARASRLCEGGDKDMREGKRERRQNEA